MPPYAEQLGSLGSRLGGAGGGAAGAAGGGFLGHLLGMLDYPRQAAANLFAGPSEGNWEKAIPGAVGILAPIIGSALAPVTGGLSLPAAIGLGSLAGGVTQGVLSHQHPDTFKAPTTEEITGSDNPLVNFAAGALMDPLTYAGGIGGAGKGAKAGAEALGGLGTKIGARMEELAPTMGAGYGGGMSKLEKLLAGAAGEADPASTWAKNLDVLRQQPPEVQRAIAGEIPSGSTLLGTGGESVAFQTPSGGVAKLTMPRSWTQPPADIPEMLQRARTAEIRGTPLREGTPQVNDLATGASFLVSHEPRLLPGTELPAELQSRLQQQLQASLRGKGIDPWDLSERNFGVDASQKPFILDPGAIQKIPEGTPFQPSIGLGTGEQPQGLLEKYLMAPIIRRDIRRQIAQQTAGEPGALEKILAEFQNAKTGIASPDLSGVPPVPTARLQRFLG